MTQEMLNTQGEVRFALVLGGIAAIALLVQWLCARRAEARRRRRLREAARLFAIQQAAWAARFAGEGERIVAELEDSAD